MRPPRTLLYVPADNARALAKAAELSRLSSAQCPDGLILDLEDAVAPEHKAQAREQARAALQAGFGVPALLRINAAGPWQDADLELTRASQPSGVVLPKAQDLAELERLNLELALWPMIETPRGVLAAPALAAQSAVAGLLVGTNDLARELRAQPSPERQELQYALQATVLAARATGKSVLDAVYNHVHDSAGFEAECEQGRRLGFDGKTVIHPAQVQSANRIFGVSAAQAQAAEQLLAAWQEARGQGKSVLKYAGRLVEELHIREAQDMLAQYRAEQTDPAATSQR